MCAALPARNPSRVVFSSAVVGTGVDAPAGGISFTPPAPSCCYKYALTENPHVVYHCKLAGLPLKKSACFGTKAPSVRPQRPFE